MRKYLLLLISLWLVSTFFVIESIHADWAHKFVVNDGKSFIISDNPIETDQIGSKIGKVTSFSDEEGTYWGNFSNYYPKGTEYYSIKGVDIDEAIAIKVNDESFVKANYNGEYEGALFDWRKLVWYIVGAFLLYIVIIFVKNNRK
ncbi:hypothetical protein [Paenibacillus endoradicis]|uniref:hypothetical protein n=1 Tax=Paenibacillus endoradicis TaxID=2972487 RepID=UPI0021595733|nr:hypothetical protein [Paenibacillus endoradicis]MCR8658790.1 hypothetical protein [Paenibacillus endoradicis]